MPKIMPPQTKTAICCARGSAIRGTFSASEMVANARMPSAKMLSRSLDCNEEDHLTHRSHNLRLHPKLILETSSKVADPALTIPSHIWHFANMVEHVSAREQQDRDQADRRPEVAVLNDGQNIWRGHAEERDQTEDARQDDGDLDVVDWTVERRMW